MTFTIILDYIGTFAFAISGIRMAAAKKFDWFGAYVVGLVTAVGGGTIRDLLLGVTPFWMLQPSYLIVTGFALLLVIILGKQLVRMNTTMFLFDAIGLGLFTVVGFEKSLAAGFPIWVNIIMGTLTGAAGGILRDTLINEVPLIFRKDVYATACILGGFIFYICQKIGIGNAMCEILSASSVILIRIWAVRKSASLPLMKDDTAEEDEAMKGRS
ncbi:MAG: trimeric intracellular cation channel family protein [Salinivirgaceae bacterium]|nr:trimeric intracellular cation channel family protein [Salinivirgaceae bacterium]MBR4620117.1 trimeric intracellular cation channel family protein [Salinivirgaceae bacterium]